MMKLLKKLLEFFSKFKLSKQPVDDAYNQVKVGDVVWALMPLGKKELANIEEQHQTRPYLVVAKDNDYFYGYYCSTKKKASNLICFKLDKLVYHHKQNTYIYLNHVYKIPCDHFRNVFDTVGMHTLMLIEKRLIVISRFIDNLIHFDVNIKYEIGDIIKVNNHLYYIYQVDNSNLYCNKALFQRESCLKYKIDYSESQIFKAKDYYELVNVLSKKNIEIIAQERKEFKQMHRHRQLKKDRIYFKYPYGSVFRDYIGNELIYLYSFGETDYGIGTNINEFFPNICVIEDMNLATLTRRLTNGEMVIMLERLLDQNINPYNVVLKLYDELMVKS